MFKLWHLPLLFGTGLVAGFVDSIAGGGGLITLPVLLSLGLDPRHALGTNKLQATFCSGSASDRTGGWFCGFDCRRRRADYAAGAAESRLGSPARSRHEQVAGDLWLRQRVRSDWWLVLWIRLQAAAG